MKACSKCCCTKPLSEFSTNGNNKISPSCRACKAAYQTKYRKTAGLGERQRADQLRIKFGITVQDYERMDMEQGGRCFICLQPESHKNKRLAVDHCHRTGTVRGLLCAACNTGLGYFKDNAHALGRAKMYVDQFNAALASS